MHGYPRVVVGWPYAYSSSQVVREFRVLNNESAGSLMTMHLGERLVQWEAYCRNQMHVSLRPSQKQAIMTRHIRNRSPNNQ